MNRIISQVPLEGDVRHCVRIESDGCDEGPQSLRGRIEAFHLLRTLADVPDLLLCGTQSFERLTMRHDGQRWIVEAESTERIDRPG